MINSILNRHTDTVLFHNITTPDEVITNPSHILTHVQQHFYQWTQYKPINSNIFDQYWHQEYRPKSSINANWYTPLLQPISIEEVLNTLQQLPNNKACGPLGISYEMLKHSGSSTIQALTSLLN